MKADQRAIRDAFLRQLPDIYPKTPARGTDRYGNTVLDYSSLPLACFVLSTTFVVHAVAGWERTYYSTDEPKTLAVYPAVRARCGASITQFTYVESPDWAAFFRITKGLKLCKVCATRPVRGNFLPDRSAIPERR